MNVNRLMITVALLASLQLAACDRKTEQPPAVVDAAAPAAAGAALQEMDAATLRARMQASMQAHRFFAPAGDNALEYMLALRRQMPGDPGVRAALVDLEPELVIAIEQSIAGGAHPEAHRLLGLLERVDASAPALPRLRNAIAAAEVATRALAADTEAKARAEAEDTALRQQADAQAATLTATRVATSPATPTAATPSPPVVPVGAPATRPPAVAADAAARQRPAPVAAADAPPVAAAAALPAATAVRPPRLLRDASPQYPVAERGRALSGTVQVAFTIDASGEVQAPRVVASTLPRAFERAALQAAARWKFEATGQNQASVRTVSFVPVGG